MLPPRAAERLPAVQSSVHAAASVGIGAYIEHQTLRDERPLTPNAQYRYAYRLCPHPPLQLDRIMDHAHGLGHEEVVASYPRLRGYQVPWGTVLWICCGAKDQLRARLLPRNHGHDACRRTFLQGWSRAYPERLLGPQDHRLDRAGHLDLLHSELVLHCLGKLLRYDGSLPLPPHRSHSPSRPGA